MKQTFAIIVLMLASIFCFAQTKAKTVQLPPSFYNQASEEVDHIQVYPPSAQLIAEDIAESDKNGTFYKVARLVPVNTTVKNSGSWETLGNGMLIWRLRLSSEGARASALYFDKFDIPSGASVYVYSSDRKIVDGPYYRSDNPDGTEYMIGNILGSDITIEYVAPMMKSGNGNVSYDNTAPIINIGEFGYVYRGEGGFETGQRGPFGDSESCEVNINCSVGADWRIQQRGVARIYVVEGYSAGYCTGTLVNNTSNDGTPYFLTADHCGPSATTSNFNQWKFRFNYEASGCSNPSSESSINYTDFTGCTKVAEGSNNGGSDFYLLRLNNFTTQNAISVNAIYNGWDRSTTAPSGGGAGIHHPAGDIKKISFFSSTPTTATYNGGSDMTGANNAHWKITWVNSGEKTGVTEGGSSGSPIFNSAGRVFGTLSGGASSCSASSSSRYDLYGKMSFHWDNSANGSTNAYKLKPWLDPNNTGATTCDYYDPANTNALTVSPNAVTLPSGGGSQTVSVRAGTSSANWTATSSASWLTVSPTSGSGLQATTSVTLTASANTGSSRTATVTFSHGGTTATVTVTQSDESDQCLIYNEDIMEDDSTATTGIGSNLYFSSYFKVIAEKVNVTGNYTLDKITFADMLNTATSGSIAIKVLSATNAGAPSTTELYSATVNVSTINNALTQGQLQGGGTCYYGEYEHTLNSPINVTGPFFISVDFTNVGAGNSSTMSNIVCIADNQNNGLDNTAYINSIYSGYTGWYLISNFFNGVDEAKFAIQAHICPSSTPATTLTVSPSSLTYIAAGETKTVTVTSNTSWTATSSASWLTISPASGSNNGTITAVAAANTSTSQRTATITVSGTGVSSQTISVTQAGDNGGETGDCVVLHEDRFTDSPSLYSVEDGGYVCGSNSYGDQAKAELFDLSGNYNLTSIDYLYAIDGSSGSVTFKVWANSNGTPGSELATKTVTMSELYNAGTSTGSGTTKQGLYTWTLTSPVAVSSNFFAGIDVSSATSYIGLASTEQGSGYTNSCYELYNGSWGDMYTSWQGLDISMYVLPTVCPISTPSYNLTVNPSSLSYTAAGGTKTVTVTSNTSWTATSSASWLTVSPASGSNNGTITAVAAANTSTSQRTATITVSGSGITRTVNVTQAAASYNLTVSPSSLSYTADAESKTVTVTSNTSWTATSSANWLTVSPASGSNNGTITAVAAANTSTSQRTATITVSGSGITRTVNVTQAAASYNLTVSPSSLSYTADGESKTVTVTSNTSWTATSSESWLTVSPASGSNNGTITVVAAANTSSSQRTATITVSGSGITRTVSVTQTGINQYTITVLSSSEIRGSVSGGGTFDEGTVTQISATANDGYAFSAWNDGNTDNPRTITVTGNATYIANFEALPQQYTITVLSSSEIRGSVSGGGTFDEGTVTQISATANDGYTFSAWNDGNTDNPRTITVTGNATYIANFEALPQQYTITVLSSSEIRGSVSGGGTFDEGTVTQISATANDGYIFSAWNDGNTDNPRTITVTGNATYIASFEVQSIIETQTTAQISIFPNPNNGMFTLSMELIEGDVTCQIVNASGSVIETREFNVTDGSEFVFDCNVASGVYFVRVISGDRVWTESVVINR